MTTREPVDLVSAIEAAVADAGQMHDHDYDAPIGPLPRLYRGVVWSDIVAEINAELEAGTAA